MKLSRLLIFAIVVGLVQGCDTHVEIAKDQPTPATTDGANTSVTVPVNKGSDPEKQDANTVLEQSLASAKSENKNVFVHIGAPW